MVGDLASQKKETWLAEFMIIIAVLGILIASFITYFSGSEEEFNSAGLQRMASSFSSKVNVVHSQWLMDNQPNIVELQTTDVDGNAIVEAINVNRKGWIDTQTTTIDCFKIWQQAMDTPLNFMNETIAVVALNLREQNKQVCRYSLSNGSYLEYSPKNGQVIVNTAFTNNG